MLAVKGIFDRGKIEFLDPVPTGRRSRVAVIFLDVGEDELYTIQESTLTPRKQRVLRELNEQGYSASDVDPGLQALADSRISLDQVRQELATIQGSLSEQVIADREER